MRKLTQEEKPEVVGGFLSREHELNPGIRWPPRIPIGPGIPGQPPVFDPGDGGN